MDMGISELMLNIWHPQRHGSIPAHKLSLSKAAKKKPGAEDGYPAYYRNALARITTSCSREKKMCNVHIRSSAWFNMNAVPFRFLEVLIVCLLFKVVAMGP